MILRNGFMLLCLLITCISLSVNFLEYDTKKNQFDLLKRRIFFHQGTAIDRDGNSIVGRQMVNFNFNDLNGRPICLNEIQSTVKIVILFNTYDCSSCLMEYRLWKDIYYQYQNKDVFILGVCCNKSQHQLDHWIQSKEIEFPVIHDPKLEIKKSMDFGTTPLRIMLNQNNKIIDIQKPQDSIENTRNVLDKIEKFLIR